MKSRQLLVLDEGHLLEKEMVEYASLTISNKRWRRYIAGLDINNVNLDCENVKKWLPSLIKIETKLLLALNLDYEIEEYAKKRFLTYGYVDQEAGNTKLSPYFLNCEPEKQIAAKVTAAATDKINHTLSNNLLVAKYSDKDYYKITSPALRIEAERDLDKLTNVVNDILFNPKNWIVVEKVVDASKTIIFKPLNIASYCAPLFDKGSRVLIMSATILDHKSFCKSLGLAPQDVKYIRVNSDFPEAGRPIYSKRVHPLNYSSL